MKKLTFSIIFVLMFFIGIIEPKAATSSELNNLNISSISDKDSLCVYEFNNGSPKDSYGIPLNIDTFTYIVIQYKYNSEQNAYQPINLTLDVKNASYAYTMTVNTKNNDNYVTSGSCGNHYISINMIPNGTDYTYELEINSSAPSNGLYYKYDSSKTSQVKSKVKVNPSGSSGSSTLNCTYNVNGREVQLSSFIAGTSGLPNYNYFRTSDSNRTACPATYEKSSLAENYSRIQITESNFKCNEWKLVANPTYGSTENSTCFYYLISSSENTPQSGSTGTIQGDLVAVYADYNNSASSIRIIKNSDNSYKAVISKGNTDITISNISNYTSVFKSGSKESYPVWINEVTDKDNKTTYQFSDKKIDGATNRNYMNVDKILDIVGLGESKVYETCEDLFTTDFLEFLNNTIFRVLYIGIPILLIVLTTFDFARVVFVDDKDGIQAAGKKFGKRVIIAVLIYLIPTILIFVGNLMGASEVEECAKTLQRIGEENKSS